MKIIFLLAILLLPYLSFTQQTYDLKLDYLYHKGSDSKSGGRLLETPNPSFGVSISTYLKGVLATNTRLSLDYIYTSTHVNYIPNYGRVTHGYKKYDSKTHAFDLSLLPGVKFGNKINLLINTGPFLRYIFLQKLNGESSITSPSSLHYGATINTEVDEYDTKVKNKIGYGWKAYVALVYKTQKMFDYKLELGYALGLANIETNYRIGEIKSNAFSFGIGISKTIKKSEKN